MSKTWKAKEKKSVSFRYDEILNSRLTMWYYKFVLIGLPWILETELLNIGETTIFVYLIKSHYSSYCIFDKWSVVASRCITHLTMDCQKRALCILGKWLLLALVKNYTVTRLWVQIPWQKFLIFKMCDFNVVSTFSTKFCL